MHHLIERPRPSVLFPALYVGRRSFLFQMRRLAWRGFRAVARRLRGRRVLDLELDRLPVPGGLTRAQANRTLAAGSELAAHAVHHPDMRIRVDASDGVCGVARKLAALHVSGAS